MELNSLYILMFVVFAKVCWGWMWEDVIAYAYVIRIQLFLAVHWKLAFIIRLF